jgi:SAM-dependent methyltransferase
MHPREDGRASSTNQKALLLGDGEGRNGVFMAELGYDVTSVDLSPVGLNKARALAEIRGVSIDTVVQDLATFDMGAGSWACIVGIFCHLPPKVRDRVLAAIPFALAPGGYAVFEAYTPAQIALKTGGPGSAEYMYSSDIFARAFGGSLQVERNEEIVREVVEGESHTGTASVVQFIGRKAL